VSSIFRAEVHAVTSLVSWQAHAAQSYVNWNVRAAEKAAHNPYVRTAAGITAGFYLGPLASGLFEGSVLGTEIAVGATGGFIAGGIITGDTRGAFYGGVTGGVFGGVSYYTQDWSAPGRITARAVTGGVTADLQGGDFRTGFIYSGASATASWGYQKIVGYIANPMPGNGLASPTGDYRPLADGRVPLPDKNIIGLNDALVNTGNAWSDFWENLGKQGAFPGTVLNVVPGINATAYLHDTVWNQWVAQGVPFNAVTNYGTMLPAAVVSYGSLLDGPLSVTLAVDGSRR